MEPAPPPPLLPQPEPEPEPAEPQGGTAGAAEAGGATEADTEGATEADTEGETEAVLPGRAPLPFDSALPLTFSVNHFGLKGVRAGSGWKRGDVLTTWRARYFLLHEDGNFLVYFLSPAESEPRGALPLGGGSFDATTDHDGCGLRLRLRGTGENLLAFDTAAERDAWLGVLQQAAQSAYVDSIANRALLPLLPSTLARAQTVFFGAAGALARHTLGAGLMPEEWAPISELAEEYWCVLCAEAQFIWLFRDQQLSKAEGLVALEDCEVLDSSEFEIGAGYAIDPGEAADGGAGAAERSTVLVVRHHLRSPHIFRFEDAEVCGSWRAQLESACERTRWRGAERTREEERQYSDRPAGGQLEAVAAAAAREAVWTSEADEAFKQKFKAAQAKAEYGWGAADLIAYTAESIASTVGAVNEALEWMPVGVDKETPSALALSREFMSKMTTEQQLSM